MKENPEAPIGDQESSPSPESRPDADNASSKTDHEARKPRPKTPDPETQREWDTIDDPDYELDIEDAPMSKLHEKSLKNEKEFQDARKAEGGLAAGEGHPDVLHMKASHEDAHHGFETMDEELKEMRKELNRELYDEDDGGVKEGD